MRMQQVTHSTTTSNKPYKVDHIQSSLGGWYEVVERPTNQTLETFDDSRTAKIRANQLNGGCGFRGWTPAYLLQRWVLA